MARSLRRTDLRALAPGSPPARGRRDRCAANFRGAVLVPAAWLEAGLDLAALLLLPLLVLAPRGAAPLVVAAGLCGGGLVLLRHRGGAAWRGVAAPAVLLGALVAWGAASAAWALDPRQSLEHAGRLA